MAKKKITLNELLSLLSPFEHFSLSTPTGTIYGLRNELVLPEDALWWIHSEVDLIGVRGSELRIRVK